MNRSPWLILLLIVSLARPLPAQAEGEWEITPESELALERGLQWLARNQGTEGSWESKHLGLVSMGSLAFLSAGHMPSRGPYGESVDRSLQFIIRSAKPSGLLNISDPQKDMYNHGLATFVLGQAHGMTNDPQMGRVLDRSLKLIYSTQCEDGGWDYQARRKPRGHDLSLAVMQAKAIRSAVDSGLEVPRDVVQLAIHSVRQHYKAQNGARGETPQAREGAGQFTYDGNRGTPAMAAAGVVCLQEFGQYDDWRIEKNLDVLRAEIKKLPQARSGSGEVPFDAYTLYYMGQAIYQAGDPAWRECYPILRDYLVQSQIRDPGNPRRDGQWGANKWVSGKDSELYGTSVACFILAMPNRYLPILQEGKIESLKQTVSTDE